MGDMRQTVAVGVIKATTPKEVAGKMKCDLVSGQRRASFSSPLPHGTTSSCSPVLLKINLQIAPVFKNLNFEEASRCIMPRFPSPCRDLVQCILSNIITVPLDCYLYFHPKEFRRIPSVRAHIS